MPVLFDNFFDGGGWMEIDEKKKIFSHVTR
jgi:hypothetical protein